MLKLDVVHAKRHLLTLELQQVRRQQQQGKQQGRPQGKPGSTDALAKRQAHLLARLEKLTLRQADGANRLQALRGQRRQQHGRSPHHLRKGPKARRCPNDAVRKDLRRSGSLLEAFPDRAGLVVVDGRFLDRLGLTEAQVQAFFADSPAECVVLLPRKRQADQLAEGDDGQPAKHEPLGRRILNRVEAFLAERSAAADAPSVVVVSARPHLLKLARQAGALLMGPQVFKHLLEAGPLQQEAATEAAAEAEAGESSPSSESEESDEELDDAAVEGLTDELDHAALVDEAEADEEEYEPLSGDFVELDTRHDADLAVALAQIYEAELQQA